jgi:hypothetical protein
LKVVSSVSTRAFTGALAISIFNYKEVIMENCERMELNMENFNELFYGENDTIVIVKNNNIVFVGDVKEIPSSAMEGIFFAKNIHNGMKFPDDRIPAFTVHFNDFDEKEKFLNEFENSDVKIEEISDYMVKVSSPVIHRFVWIFKEMIKFFE